MSTILKALRRLEEQKNHGPERPLRDEVVLAPARRSTRGATLRAAVAGGVLALAGAMLLYALRPAPPAPERIVVTVPAPPPVAAAPPAAEPVAPPPAPVAVAPPVEPPPADFEIVRPDPSAGARPLRPLALPTIGEAPVADEAEIERSPAGSLPEYVEEPLEAPIDASPEPRMVARGAAPVRVARTLWHPNPDRRLAWVEVSGQTALREVREGERVGPYVVREIEPAAVTFAEGDVELRREVGP